MCGKLCGLFLFFHLIFLISVFLGHDFDDLIFTKVLTLNSSTQVISASCITCVHVRWNIFQTYADEISIS